MPCCSCKNFYKTTHEWMASLFGVFLKQDVMPKITNPANFLDWSWWFWITPKLHGTVLARPRFHLTVLGYLLTLNLVFWNEYFSNYILFDEPPTMATAYVTSWASRLMVFVLTGFMFRLVTAYWIGTRLKAAQLLIGTSKVIDVLITSIDYDNPRAEEFLPSLWGAIHLIGHYAFTISSKNTKYKLSEKEVVDMFEEHGYEAEPLLKLHVKNTINKLHWGILQSIKKERMSGGCMESMNGVEHVQLLESISLMSGGAMSTMSCTSSNKLPFALFHLVNWVVSESCIFYAVAFFVLSVLCHDPLTKILHILYTTDKTDVVLLPCDCLRCYCK